MRAVAMAASAWITSGRKKERGKPSIIPSLLCIAVLLVVSVSLEEV
jgi:hypothetical protein